MIFHDVLNVEGWGCAMANKTREKFAAEVISEILSAVRDLAQD